jgi:Domain of unknown function (DUF6249)
MSPRDLMLFLLAAIVAGCTFGSIAIWIGARSSERRSRDRSALLRAVVEQQSDNARLVLEHLRDLEVTRKQEAREQERRGTLQGSLILIAVGIALALMMASMSPNSGAWSIGLIPLFIGIALLIAMGVLNRPRDPE